MPFEVSDNESEVDVDAPVASVKDDVIGDVVDEEEEEADEDEDDQVGEDEFVVEKILSHRIDDGVPYYEVKWEGYEKLKDRTWEPEDNIKAGASLILDQYLESIGGREQLFADHNAALKSKKRGRASTGAAQAGKRSRKNGDHPSDEEPPLTARAATWKPPAGSWEDHIAQLDACEDEETGKLMVYLTWKNGHKTQHETPVIYQRCPQKMLQFYERHVRIIKADPDAEFPTSPRLSD